MKRRTFLPLASSGLLCLVLTACTSFAPVYGDRSSSGIAPARFNFAPPDNRLEQVILNRLKVAFPGEAGPNDPVLDLQVSSSSLASPLSDTFSVARPIQVRLQATVTIARDGATAFVATRFVDSSYQSGKLTPVIIAAKDGVEDTAAGGLAESIRAAILAEYRPDVFAVGGY